MPFRHRYLTHIRASVRFTTRDIHIYASGRAKLSATTGRATNDILISRARARVCVCVFRVDTDVRLRVCV